MTKKILLKSKMGKVSSSGTQAIIINITFYAVVLFAVASIVASRVATEDQTKQDSPNWISKIIATFVHDEKFLIPSMIAMSLVVAAAAYLATTYQFPMSIRKLK